MQQQYSQYNIQSWPDHVPGQGWKVKGSKRGRVFELYFTTREEAAGFIKGFQFTLQRDLV